MGGTQTVLIALAAGFFPSLIWLAFWLREDRCEPEPKLRLALVFLAGMASVGLVLPLEEYTATLLSGTTLIFAWAATEELFKLGAAALFGFASRAYDEPIDAVIYLITAALGFAASENALFLWNPLHGNELVLTALTGDLRFVGATLLHVLASATVGLAMAYAFYSSSATRAQALIFGVILAIALHAFFNFFILQAGGALTISAFLSIWTGIVALLLFIERVKHPARDYC